jgi:copper oxidase (laccase) domain-containing protein
MEKLGANRRHIRAAIGPTIHQPAYEVGPEFKAQFLEQAPGNAQFFTIPPPSKYTKSPRDHFDLPGYCRRQLQSLDLASVDDLGRCTYADESLFFSYRRKTHRNESDYGRQMAAIVVP